MLLKYGRITLEEFAQRFTDPFLRRAFPTIVYDWPQTPLMMLLSFLSRTHVGDYGWPAGGSIALAGAIERRFLELGGEIRCRARVQSILVENDRAVGVRLDDGSEQRADIVVSNANGHATIFEMLGGRYTSPAIRSYYGAPEDRIEMGIHVSLGLARDLASAPHAIVLPLDEPVTIAGEARQRLYVEPFGFDPSLAPAGKSTLKVVMATSFKYWQEQQRTPERYHEAKQRVAETVIRLLEKRFPGLRQQIEVIDVATPMTTLRFTGNGHGFRSPVTAMARALFTGRRLSQTLPGLENFYMVGQWAGVAGVPLVAAMGRDVVRAICRRDRRPFTTASTPAVRRHAAAASASGKTERRAPRVDLWQCGAACQGQHHASDAGGDRSHEPSLDHGAARAALHCRAVLQRVRRLQRERLADADRALRHRHRHPAPACQSPTSAKPRHCRPAGRSLGVDSHRLLFRVFHPHQRLGLGHLCGAAGRRALARLGRRRQGPPPIRAARRWRGAIGGL
jgi:hypothetical protein